MTSPLRRFVRRARKQLEFAKLRYSANFGRYLDSGNRPSAAVIVQSFARPQNIELIVKLALRCRFVDSVIVSNNNPEVDLKQWVRIKDSRYTLISQNQKMPCGTRFDIAKGLPHRHFICIDDDVFLRPCQIMALYSSLLDNQCHTESRPKYGQLQTH